MAKQLAQWNSHKQVRAGKIYEIVSNGPEVADHVGAEERKYLRVKGIKLYGARLTVGTDDGGKVHIDVHGSVFARGVPDYGDYLVIYSQGEPDEYTSWSPAKAFEEGYTRA